jgi:acyl carrier protein
VTRRDRRSRARAGDDASLEHQVDAVIAATFDLDEDDLPIPASRETIAAWTSCSQMTLLLNLEQRFDVSFSLEQAVTMTSAQRIRKVLRDMM